jgi:hypothetical protein
MIEHRWNPTVLNGYGDSNDQAWGPVQQVHLEHQLIIGTGKPARGWRLTKESCNE